jgi:CRP-like cAMP-binding protein
LLSSSVSRNLNFHVFQKQTLSLLSLASLRTIWRAEALRRVALLAPLSGAERSALAAALQPRVVEAGSDVVVAGEAGAEFFLVESGELDVLAPPKGDATSAAAPVAAAPAAAAAAAAADVAASEDGEKGSSREPPPLEVVGRIGAGGYFGELSLLRGEPRAATVRAATRCELLALPRRDFEALLGPAKALLAAGASSYGRVGGENLFFLPFSGGGRRREGSKETKEGEEEAEVEISTHCSSNLAPSLFLFRSFFLI